jgi:hypothetical protein
LYQLFALFAWFLCGVADGSEPGNVLESEGFDVYEIKLKVEEENNFCYCKIKFSL